MMHICSETEPGDLVGGRGRIVRPDVEIRQMIVSARAKLAAGQASYALGADWHQAASPSWNGPLATSWHRLSMALPGPDCRTALASRSGGHRCLTVSAAGRPRYQDCCDS